MLFSSLFFGPFALMVCIYIHIFCIVKRHQATRLRFRRAGSSVRARASETLRSNSRQMARNVKAIHTTLYILGKTTRWKSYTVVKKSRDNYIEFYSDAKAIWNILEFLFFFTCRKIYIPPFAQFLRELRNRMDARSNDVHAGL